MLRSSHPARLPEKAIFSLVLKDDLNLTRWNSVILSTFTVSMVKTPKLEMSKFSWKQKLKFGKRR